jgi:hypothetical protein
MVSGFPAPLRISDARIVRRATNQSGGCAINLSSVLHNSRHSISSFLRQERILTSHERPFALHSRISLADFREGKLTMRLPAASSAQWGLG